MTDTSEKAAVPALAGAVEDPITPKTMPNLDEWIHKVKAAKSARQPFEREWYLNISFLFGKQWVQWDAGATSNYVGTLIEPKLPPHRVRLTVNIIRRLVNRQFAKMTKEEIRGFISPSTSDDEDIAAARAGERLNTYLIDQTKLSDRLNRAVWWALATGTAFTKDYYDENIALPGPKQTEQQLDPTTGMPVEVEVDTKMYGCPVVETISPFHILVPNVDEPDLDLQEWVCHVTIKTTAQIKHQFGVDLSADESKISGNSIESQLQAAQGFKANHNKKGVEVFELWVKPCVDYPDGMILTWTGQKILNYYETWEHGHMEYPFCRVQFVETGRFYGESTITDLRPIQVEYNKTRSQAVEDKNRMARPALVAQRGSIDPRQVKGRPGEIIFHQPGTPAPTALQQVGIPNWYTELLTLLQNEMGDIAEQNSLEQSIPAGVTAATAISYVQESQDLVLGNALKEKERAFERICRHLLSYVIQYWDAQRQIKVVGQDQNFETFLLKASDLRGNTDWRVVSGSATPQSRAAKQALLMELMKSGFIPVDKGLQFLDLGDTTRVFEEMQVDVREAERQNLMMSKGEPSVTADWQNLLVHIQVHDNYRKREEFQNSGPDIQALFRHHVFMDMYLLAKQLAPEMVDPNMNPMIMQAFIDPTTGMHRGLNPQTGQVDPLFVPPMLEEVLRGFVIQLQSGMQAPPTQGGATTQPPQGG